MSYGERIEKVHCSNHFLKNIRTYLESYKDKYKELKKSLTPKIIERFIKIFRMFLSEKCNDHSYLEKHILNLPYHVFGIHKECDIYYCDNNHKFEKIDYDKLVMKDLFDYFKFLSKKSKNLKEKITSNLAESYHSLNSRYNYGKIRN